MPDVNEVRIEGRLGGFPKVHEYKGQTNISFSIATNDELVDSAGFITETTIWNRICVSGQLALDLLDELRTGLKVMVTGKLVTRDWKTPTGERRYITEVRAYAVDIASNARRVNADADKPMYPETAARVAAARTAQRATPPPLPPTTAQDWAERRTAADNFDDMPF